MFCQVKGIKTPVVKQTSLLASISWKGKWFILILVLLIIGTNVVRLINMLVFTIAPTQVNRIKITMCHFVINIVSCSIKEWNMTKMCICHLYKCNHLLSACFLKQ